MRFHYIVVASFIIGPFGGYTSIHCQDDGIGPVAKVHVPDAGFVRKGKSAPAKHRLLKLTESDNAKIYEIVHNGKPSKIVVRSNGSINVTHTKTYRLKDLEQLRLKHPEIYMHFRTFPQSTSDNWPVRLTLEIESVCTAKSKDELKRKSREAYEIYCRYVEPKKIQITVTPTIVIQDE